jgi:SAM-dependent methyltransferase
MNHVNALPAHAPSFIVSLPSSLALACPTCRVSLSNDLHDSLRCSSCGFVLRQLDGIWRALTPERFKYYESFIHDYETIRLAEGRGSSDATYYLSLPYRDSTGNLDWQWQIRGATYRCVESRVWPAIESHFRGGFDLLDIGAGTGWLCYRVALRGHRPVALDVVVNELDGLGAARHYWPVLKQPFACFQAEMDALPFAEGQFDVVVFNASLHYSTNYLDTLREALRCLRSQGHLLVMDSPLYHAEESGRQMLRERHLQFKKQFGFPSDSVPSIEFLTFAQVQSLGRELGLSWKALRPWYGLVWSARPLKAWLKGGREPSKFHVLWGQRTVQ